MTPPRLLLALGALAALLLLPAAPASALSFESALGTQNLLRASAPLEGEGSPNMKLVANLPIGRASDLELHGDYAFIGSYDEGMVIVDISDPTKPERAGVFACGGGSQYDVQLSPDAKLAMLSTDSKNSKCHPGQEGTMVIDVSDPANPRELSFIPIQIGTHTHTLDGPLLYINNYQTSYSKFEIYDLTNPSAPAKLSELKLPAGQPSAHDSYIDHRPDGRVLMYPASGGNLTDVIDVTDPRTPKLLQRVQDSSVSFSHQAEPNFDRSLLMVTDEYQGGGSAPACGKSPRAEESPLPGLVEAETTDIGALHFYRLDPDGTLKANGTSKPPTFNLPTQANPPDAGCTIHVYWQAPDQDRLVTAWYGRGVRIVDYSATRDGKQATELGHFIPEGTDMWSAKPHKGYIFTGDLVRGMDVLRYEGEGWPKTSGPAEAQRAKIQGNYKPGTTTADKPAPGKPVVGGTPTAPSGAGQSARKLGAYRFTRRLKVPGRRGAKRRLLTVTIADAQRRVVSKLRFRVRRGRTVSVRARGAGEAGRYRYVVRRGDQGEALLRGSFTVKPGSTGAFKVPTGRTLVCRIV